MKRTHLAAVLAALVVTHSPLLLPEACAQTRGQERISRPPGPFDNRDNDRDRDRSFGRTYDRDEARDSERRDRYSTTPQTAHRLGDLERIDRLMRQEVRDSRGQQVGRVEDVVLDLESGRILYVLINATDGQYRRQELVAIPPGVLRIERRGELALDTESRRILQAPQLPRDPELGSVAFAQELYRYHNQPTWWNGQGQRETFGNVHRASRLLDMQVRNVANAEIGNVDNLIVDLPAGYLTYVVLDSRQVGRGDSFLIPPQALTRSQDQRGLFVDLDQNRLSRAPRMTSLQEAADPQYASQVYQYYGKQPYFAGAATGRGAEVGRGQGVSLGEVKPAQELFRQEVIDSNGNMVGRIGDLVVDLESGRVLYAIVSARAVQALSDRVAIPPELFQKGRQENWVLKVDRRALANAPQYNEQQLASANFLSQVYRHHNLQPWWREVAGGRPDQPNFGNAHRVTDLLDARVLNVSDTPVGEIENLYVDLPAGRLTYVILSASRLLGPGEQFVLPPQVFTRGRQTQTFVADVDQSMLQRAPRFMRDGRRLSDPTFAAQVYRYYGKEPYFGELTPTSDPGAAPIRR